jgi:hypothetical protein
MSKAARGDEGGNKWWWRNRYGIEKAWVTAFIKVLATAGWEAGKEELDADCLMIWTVKMLTPYESMFALQKAR